VKRKDFSIISSVDTPAVIAIALFFFFSIEQIKLCIIKTIKQYLMAKVIHKFNSITDVRSTLFDIVSYVNSLNGRDIATAEKQEL
jgi:hypothetical protein